jgi:predicted alpha/beta superfamily hydrolase
MKSTLFSLVCLAASAVMVAAEAPPVILQGTAHHKLASTQIGQTYDLFVSLPEDYASSGKSYPVLYVLDGWHFPLLASLQNNNIYSERMPPVIMVNIGHGQGVNPMPLRERDFTPTKTSGSPASGGAPAFLNFLEHDIIPLIERTYRTIPADRGLLGHSMGGLFALYALEERPALFQRIVAASPVANWDRDLLIKAAAEKLKHLPKPVRLDLSVGDDEHDVYGYDLTNATAAFAKKLDDLRPANLDYRLTVYPGENHNSVRFASFPPGLYWVYRSAAAVVPAGPDSPVPATITALLQEFLAKNSDRAQHDRFWADDLIYTGSGATVRTKAEIMKSFDEDKTAPAKPLPADATVQPTYSAEDIVVRPYGSTAALTFRLVAQNPDGTVQYYRNSGTLLLRDGRWQVVTWQATKVPPPEKK